MKALFYVHMFVSGNHQMYSLLYSVLQLHHVCRVNAEEDVQDFRLLRPGLDPAQVIVLFLCSERDLHRGRPHPGKLLSDKVFLLLLLAERPSSLHERCLYPILLAVVSVVGSGITGVSSHFLCFNYEQPLMHLQAMYQPCILIEGIELNSHIVS